MDKKTTITVGRSVQVFKNSEQWVKISVSKEFPEDVNVQLAIDDLFLEVEKAHGKHSVTEVAPAKSNGDIYFNVSKNKEERG